MNRAKWAKVAAVLAALAVVAAGADWVLRGGSALRPGGRVDAETVAFHHGHWGTRYPGGAILRGRSDAAAFASRFAGDGGRYAPSAGEVLAKLTRPGLEGKTLIAFSTGVGCATAEGAALWGRGNDLSLELLDSSSSDECADPYEAMAVFALPPQRVPAQVTLSGEAPTAAGPARTVAFEKLKPGPLKDVRGAEVSDGGRLDRFLKGVPSKTAAAIRKAVRAEPQEGRRRFAFVVPGCRRDGAVLALEENHLGPYPAEPEPERVCGHDERALVVFELDTRLFPEGPFKVAGAREILDAHG